MKLGYQVRDRSFTIRVDELTKFLVFIVEHLTDDDEHGRIDNFGLEIEFR